MFRHQKHIQLANFWRIGLPFASGYRVQGSDYVRMWVAGDPETRKHEFRRCSVCGAVNYCSRACQALDWKLRHKEECAPVERWVEDEGIDGEAGVVDGNENGVIDS